MAFIQKFNVKDHRSGAAYNLGLILVLAAGMAFFAVVLIWYLTFFAREKILNRPAVKIMAAGKDVGMSLGIEMKFVCYENRHEDSVCMVSDQPLTHAELKSALNMGSPCLIKSLNTELANDKPISYRYMVDTFNRCQVADRQGAREAESQRIVREQRQVLAEESLEVKK